MPLLVVLCTVWQKKGTNFLLCASFSVLDRCSSNHHRIGVVVLGRTNVCKPEHLNARGTSVVGHALRRMREATDVGEDKWSCWPLEARRGFYRERAARKVGK